jgi:hypothetical protein
MVCKLKRPPTDGRKYSLAVHQIRTDNRNYRELTKLNSPQTNEPIKKCATELTRAFSKEEVQIAKNT